MDRLRLGFTVFGVDDRRLGDIAGLNECCFEVRPVDREEARLMIVPEAIFNVVDARVTLVCGNDEVHRYACAIHSPTVESSP